MTQKQVHHKRHPSMADSLQNLGNWSTLYSLQEIQQVGEYPFQVTQLIKTSFR